MAAEETTLDYLRPEIAQTLGNLELVAKHVVEGFITGLHKSPYHGFSVEFAQHRPYLPGDAIRGIDWKLYARTDRYYIKQFEEETNLKAYLVLDASASMNFSGDPKRVSKYTYGTYLAASLAYLLTRQQDAVGLVLFDEAIRSFMPARLKRTWLREILRILQTTKPEKQTATKDALRVIAEKLNRKGLVVVISDLFDEPSEILVSLRLLRHIGHEVLVFHLLDPIEVNFKIAASSATILDMETGESLKTQPFEMQMAYQNAMTKYLTDIRSDLLAEGIDYLMIKTDEPFDRALAEYLHKRQRMG